MGKLEGIKITIGSEELDVALAKAKELENVLGRVYELIAKLQPSDKVNKFYFHKV